MNKNEYHTPFSFIDLEAQQSLIRDKIDLAISKVLDHGQYIMGPEVKELELKLQMYTKAKYCVTCASGTDALIIALKAQDHSLIFVVASTVLSIYLEEKSLKSSRH